jgi:hypothetical protein
MRAVGLTGGCTASGCRPAFVRAGLHTLGGAACERRSQSYRDELERNSGSAAGR